INGWDYVRGLSGKIMELMPSPLPGYDKQMNRMELVQQCLFLACSPRLVESDGGALLLNVLFDKFVRNLCISFNLQNILQGQSFRTFAEEKDCKTEDFETKQCKKKNCFTNEWDAIYGFLNSLNELLSSHITMISETPFHLRYKSPKDRIHGFLTFLRQVLPQLKLRDVWNSNQWTVEKKAQWGELLRRLLENVLQIGHLSLELHTRGIPSKHISYKHMYIYIYIYMIYVCIYNGKSDPTKKSIEVTRDQNDEIVEEDNGGVQMLGVDCRGHMQFSGLTDYSDQQSEQIIVVSSWLGVKEACWCLAQFVETCPLPKHDTTEKHIFYPMEKKHVVDVGKFFLQTLQTTCHSGVIEKSHIGFTLVCKELLDSGKISFALFFLGKKKN
ncbi:hypothetical protein RFI_20896, partial [Reticulomyxa filosa]